MRVKESGQGEPKRLTSFVILRNEPAYQSLRNGLVLLYLAAVVFVVFLIIETLGLGWWESGTSTAKMPSSGTNEFASGA